MMTMLLVEFARPATPRDATVSVLNPESECPVYRLLTRLFDDDAVTVQDARTDADTVPSDVVLVETDDDTDGFAVSPLDAIRDELLLVNSDIYVTGARDLDAVQTPDAIAALDEIPFTVSGFPENPKEKLLLIEMSRHIEAMAWQAGEGRLATGFQYLSRFDDETGTEQVYTQLGSETDVETHVYGAPDAEPSIPGVTVHGIDTSEIRQTWFVAYQSTHHPHEAAALVATQTAQNTWQGSWTYDSDRVADMFTHLEQAYPAVKPQPAD